MPSPPSTIRAILFADVVGSTALYERHGDQKAYALVSRALAQATAAVAESRGAVIKFMGDGLLAQFDQGSQALSAAEAIVGASDLKAAPAGETLERVPLRVAVHWGPVVDTDDDVFGDVVNTAARMLEVANSDELLVSRDLVETLPEADRARARAVRPLHVRHKQDALELFTIAVRVEDITATVPNFEPIPREHARLQVTLRFHDVERILWGEGSTLTLGRDPDRDIIVSLEYTSRQHATVRIQGGRCHLEDHSANGSWIAADGMPELRVHRGHEGLAGSGRLFLGCDPGTSSQDAVLYEVRGES